MVWSKTALLSFIFIALLGCFQSVWSGTSLDIDLLATYGKKTALDQNNSQIRSNIGGTVGAKLGFDLGGPFQWNILGKLRYIPIESPANTILTTGRLMNIDIATGFHLNFRRIQFGLGAGYVNHNFIVTTPPNTLDLVKTGHLKAYGTFSWYMLPGVSHDIVVRGFGGLYFSGSTDEISVQSGIMYGAEVVVDFNQGGFPVGLLGFTDVKSFSTSQGNQSETVFGFGIRIFMTIEGDRNFPHRMYYPMHVDF